MKDKPLRCYILYRFWLNVTASHFYTVQLSTLVSVHEMVCQPHVTRCAEAAHVGWTLISNRNHCSSCLPLCQPWRRGHSLLFTSAFSTKWCMHNYKRSIRSTAVVQSAHFGAIVIGVETQNKVRFMLRIMLLTSKETETGRKFSSLAR